MVATLSISGRKISHCHGVVQAMQQLGICGDVTGNVSVAPDGTAEIGCRVLILGEGAHRQAKALWETVQARYGLECAHVRLPHTAGCTYDVFAPSRCPSSLTDSPQSSTVSPTQRRAGNVQ